MSFRALAMFAANCLEREHRLGLPAHQALGVILSLRATIEVRASRGYGVKS